MGKLTSDAPVLRGDDRFAYWFIQGGRVAFGKRLLPSSLPEPKLVDECSWPEGTESKAGSVLGIFAAWDLALAAWDLALVMFMGSARILKTN
ncbi:hypothetical protein VNO77_44191 [Canavalia gladiata]|uniref:Uncharacterized protein n=1 Tax=Canavalia gladiata TaxID=3824 RepID=A0AAN9JVK9_CANGL